MNRSLWQYNAQEQIGHCMEGLSQNVTWVNMVQLKLVRNWGGCCNLCESQCPPEPAAGSHLLRECVQRVQSYSYIVNSTSLCVIFRAHYRP